MPRVLAPLVFVALLLCNPPTACCQRIDCLPAATRLRIADSLRILPLVRQEARLWRLAYVWGDSASRQQGRAYDTLSQAYVAAVRAEQARAAEAAALRLQVATWKATARRRNARLFTVLGAAVGGSVLLLAK